MLTAPRRSLWVSHFSLAHIRRLGTPERSIYADNIRERHAVIGLTGIRDSDVTPEVAGQLKS